MRAFLAVLLASAAFLGALGGFSPVAHVPVVGEAAASSPTPLYFNGTVVGVGTTVSVYLPAPSNGTVWDLVSASITITSATAVTAVQNSYLYDSTCTQLSVPPAPSACVGLYGPNVDGWANDVMLPGESGTYTGAGGYAAKEPTGLTDYTFWEQTLHLNADMFTTFGADLSVGVTSTYHVVMVPEVGTFPSFAFYRWGTPVRPMDGSLVTISIPGPPPGYVYRTEVSVSTLEIESALGPDRLSEVVVEPSGFVLDRINSWTAGHTDTAGCGGYSSGQTCSNDNGVGTATVWDAQVIVDSNDSYEAEFVAPAGDAGEFAVVATEYPANDIPSGNTTGQGGPPPTGGTGAGSLPGVEFVVVAAVAGLAILGLVAIVVVGVDPIEWTRDRLDGPVRWARVRLIEPTRRAGVRLVRALHLRRWFPRAGSSVSSGGARAPPPPPTGTGEAPPRGPGANP